MGLRFGFIFLLTLAFGTLHMARPALAQSEEGRERARTLFQEGVSRFDAGDFDQALQSFEQAYVIAPHPSVRINIANCLEQLGRYSEAVDTYQSFLSESENLKPAQRAEINKTIERLSRHFGTVTLQLSPSYAQVTLDGAQPRRNGDGALIVPTGEHVLRATYEGYEPGQRNVQVDGGSTQTVVLTLSPAAPPVQVAPAPVMEEQPTPTEEPVRGYEEPVSQASGPSRVWLWTAVGATALLTVGFVTTAGLTYKAQGDFDHSLDISRDVQQPLAVRATAYDDASDAKDRAEKLAMVSDVLLGGAVVAAGATVVIWLVGKRRADRPVAFDAQPLVTRHAAGLSLRGQF